LDIDSENFDPEEGVRLLTLSAMQGFDVAMYRLGKLYLQGEVVEKNVGEALQWFWEADAKDNPYAQYQLGKIYLKGEDVSANYVTAQRMFEKSVRQGNAYVSDRRGTSFRVDTLPIGFPVLLLLRAIGRHSKYRCISPCLEDASLQASTSRMKMYLYGQRVDKDYELAVQLLTSSASKGNEYAQHILDNYHPYTHSSSATVLASMRLLARLSQIIRDDRLSLHDPFVPVCSEYSLP